MTLTLQHLPSYFYLLALLNFEMFGYLVVDFCLDFKSDVNEGLRRVLEERVNMFKSKHSLNATNAFLLLS